MNFVMNCRGKLLDLTVPQVMGIVNLSANSFYSESYQESTKSVLSKIEQHLLEGAALIDIGAQSTKPGAPELTCEQELDLLLPAFKAIEKQNYNCFFSVDTYRSEVAKQVLEDSSVQIINDIGGGRFDPKLIPLLGSYGDVPYILMHNKTKSADMINHTDYDNLILEMFDYFLEQLALCDEAGIRDVVLDVGIGFSKKLQHNFEILNQLHVFQSLNKPMLMGLSRKSFIYKTLKMTPEECLPETSAMHMVALMGGSQILRVHDVAAAKNCITLFQKLTETK